MFVVEELPREKPDDEGKRMFDRDRDAWLQAVVRRTREHFTAFKLVWREKVIPFDAEYSIGPPAGFQSKIKNHLHWTIAPQRGQPFGVSPMAGRRGAPSYEFSSDAEREAALLLAVEALLEYGDIYDGKKWDKTRVVTVEHSGRIWSKESFSKSKSDSACTV